MTMDTNSQLDLLNRMMVWSESNMILLTVVGVVFGALCAWIAARRGGHWVYWLMMGFSLGPLALPFVFFAKPKKPPAASAKRV